MLRGLAILGGVALIEQFHFVIYVLGVLLLVLAYRILQGVDENVDPDKNFVVRLVRKVFPVTPDDHGGHWFVKIDGKRHATPIFLCLAAIVAADIAFAVDSIPAAFAITRDSVLIWMGNVFALLGLRALFVLVEGMIRRFRYLDETIAVVLALVAVKLLIEDIYKIGPVGSLAIVAAAFAVGIIASIIADRRDPDADAKREERGQRTSRSAGRRGSGGEAEAAERGRGGAPALSAGLPRAAGAAARRRRAVRANGSATARPSATDIAATGRRRRRRRAGRRRSAARPRRGRPGGRGRRRRRARGEEGEGGGRRSWAQCRPEVRSGPATVPARNL